MYTHCVCIYIYIYIYTHNVYVPTETCIEPAGKRLFVHKTEFAEPFADRLPVDVRNCSGMSVGFELRVAACLRCMTASLQECRCFVAACWSASMVW